MFGGDFTLMKNDFIHHVRFLKIYVENAEIKFVGSTYFGIGYVF